METYNQVIALWQSYNITTPAELDTYLDSFHVLIAYHYTALQRYDEAEELDGLYDFFKRQTEKTWSKTLGFRHGIRPECSK